ncbi:hypothetical protein [Streptomyces beihaiensis]|uniref:Uncharacterized protein n=1 Tax=Streptomyces beihaiensis TaxID=2984495 RepID=A0ABT3U230_9ACTN|nr:hypothetical protein [Streptomyces beihaiensis]MCX3063120.1 hypothetical protein [Streptomyces beihaiensis]
MTMHKPTRASSVTRRLQKEAAEVRRERPEVRKDIRKTWWPDE